MNIRAIRIEKVLKPTPKHGLGARIYLSMPRYAFRCNACKRGFHHYVSYAEYENYRVTCPQCKSQDTDRRIGRVALGKSEEGRMAGLADESMLAGLDGEDPQALGKFMRQMSQETGEALGDDFGEVVDRLEKGQSPDDIERAMPDLE